MVHRLRLLCGAALGDPAKCAPYVELWSHPERGRYGHYFHPGGEIGIRSIGDFGSLILLSYTSPVSLSVIKWPREAPVEQRHLTTNAGHFLTFRFIAHPGGGLGASRTFRSFSECKTDDTDQNACVLDDDRLGARFGLPALKTTRVVSRHDTKIVEGNYYYFDVLNYRYWLTVGQPGVGGPWQYFGFAMATPQAIATKRADSMFEFGCQIEEK